MAIGVIGRKVGMTRIFTEDGVSLPVTVIEVEPNRVTQVKTLETDGYRALQVTVGARRATRVTKPMAGHFAKAGVEAGRKVARTWTTCGPTTKPPAPKFSRRPEGRSTASSPGWGREAR